MLNPDYFNERKYSSLKEEILKNVGNTQKNSAFLDKVSFYLKEEYDYPLSSLLSDIGITNEVFSEMFDSEINPIDFAETLIEELSFLHSNRFNTLYGSHKPRH